jgi:hypothetical protein
MRDILCNRHWNLQKSQSHLALLGNGDEVIPSMLVIVLLVQGLSAAMVWLNLTSLLQVVVEAG